MKRATAYADVKAKKPVDPNNTIFRLASISKLFTWVSVMQLVEQGKLNLDTDVNHYLDFQIHPAFNKPITLRNLMTHTGGFEEVLDDIIVLDAEATAHASATTSSPTSRAVSSRRARFPHIPITASRLPATSCSAPAASPSSSTSRSTSSRR